MKKLIRVWFLMSRMAAQSQLITLLGGGVFIIGKVIRFLFFFAFLFSVLSKTETLVGYSREQVILFFLIFNLVDIMVQFLFRGVYRFRFLIVSGDYDLDLLKPLPSFFRPVFGWTDILDLLTLFPLWGFFLWFVFYYQLSPSIFQFLGFLAFLFNSLILAFAFHLLVCALGIKTTEVDHLVWIYRDLTNMARFPTDIYKKGIQFVLTFTIPVVILMTVPAKALMGILAWPWLILSFLLSGLFLWGSLRFWKQALTQYSSASS